MMIVNNENCKNCEFFLISNAGNCTCTIHKILIPKVSDATICSKYNNKGKKNISKIISLMESDYLYQCFTDVSYEPRKLISINDIQSQITSASIYFNGSKIEILIPAFVIKYFPDSSLSITIILEEKTILGSLEIEGENNNEIKKIILNDLDEIKKWVNYNYATLEGIEIYKNNNILFKKYSYPILIELLDEKIYKVRIDLCMTNYLIWCSKMWR